MEYSSVRNADGMTQGERSGGRVRDREREILEMTETRNLRVLEHDDPTLTSLLVGMRARAKGEAHGRREKNELEGADHTNRVTTSPP